VAEGLGGEVKAAANVLVVHDGIESIRVIPVQPHKALGGSVLLLLELVKDEVLEGF
jgi:hypothetical protein